MVRAVCEHLSNAHKKMPLSHRVFDLFANLTGRNGFSSEHFLKDLINYYVGLNLAGNLNLSLVLETQKLFHSFLCAYRRDSVNRRR